MIATHPQRAMTMMIEYEIQDFEIPPPTPMQQLQEIVDLAHQCISMQRAYVSINMFGGSDAVTVYIATGDDVTLTEYPSLREYMLTPTDEYWSTAKPMLARLSDQIALKSIIDRLNEVLV